MTPLRRLVLCTIVPTILGACFTSGAGAALLPGCGAPADSALNQYCESTPSPQGPQRPAPGEATVGQSPTLELLKSARRATSTSAELRHQGPKLRRLLALPARSPVAACGAVPPASGNQRGGPSVSDLALMTLGATLIAGIAGLAAGRRRAVNTAA